MLPTGLPAPTASASTVAYSPGAIQHVIWILMENRSEPAIIGSAKAPYLNTLATEYGLATDYHNITHPSVPNYLALTSGLPLASLPVTDCTKCRQPGPSLFTQGETWKAYEESMSAPCARNLSADGLYYPKHNPALYYTQIPSTVCKADDVAYPALAVDLADDTLPAFAFIAPNVMDDMHTGTIAQGDAWLASNLPSILNSAAYQSGSTAVFITWDEGTGTGKTNGTDCTNAPTSTSCNVALLAVNPYTPPGTRATGYATHYSLLRLTEEILGLPLLDQAAAAPDLAPQLGL
jgi:phospholipase C